MIRFFSFRRRNKWQLRPHPRFKDLTVGVAEAACTALDLDVDLLLSGELVPDDLEAPALSRAQAFLEAVLQNGKSYDVSQWPAHLYQPIMAGIVAGFMAGLFMSWR